MPQTQKEGAELRSKIYWRAVDEGKIAVQAKMNAETIEQKRFAERARVKAEKTKALLDPSWRRVVDSAVETSRRDTVKKGR